MSFNIHLAFDVLSPFESILWTEICANNVRVHIIPIIPISHICTFHKHFSLCTVHFIRNFSVFFSFFLFFQFFLFFSQFCLFSKRTYEFCVNWIRRCSIIVILKPPLKCTDYEREVQINRSVSQDDVNATCWYVDRNGKKRT